MSEDKKQYGLIGLSLTHSFSQKYFTKKFAELGLKNHKYSLFPISEVSKFTNIITSNKNLYGLNVTTPYKETIIPFLDELDENVLKLGTVNVIKVFREGDEHYLKGYNTDYYGLLKTLKNLNLPQGCKALILGSGGSAKTTRQVLEEMGIATTNVSRNPSRLDQTQYSKLTPRTMADYQLIVNATPLGMFPNVTTCPDIPYEGITANHICFDLVYNPETTVFLEKCRQRGAQICNGLTMLYEQADKAWEIWNK
ncbi:MAG: shikimate dehydrogenase [Bacteroidales bacterium]|nr:shikimate dehydrogenase [Bacteroidales bacterium]